MKMILLNGLDPVADIIILDLQTKIENCCLVGVLGGSSFYGRSW